MILADIDDHPSERPPTLYVNNIDPKTTEKQLYDLFVKHGNVKKVNLRKRVTYRPDKCSYALIEYTHNFEAERALQAMRYMQIGNNEIVVMFADDRSKLKPEGKVFFKNLPPQTTVLDLHNLFSQISPNLYVTIMINERGQKCDCGFVHFFDPDHAKEAFEKLQGHTIGENKLELEGWHEKKEDDEKKVLVVTNIPSGKEEKIKTELIQLFGKFGFVESFELKWQEKYQAYSGILVYKDSESAEKACSESSSNPMKLEGRSETLGVEWHKTKKERFGEEEQATNNRIYVRNLKISVTEQNIEEAFDEIKFLESVILKPFIIKGKTVSKFAVIGFESEEDAEVIYAKAPKNENIKKLFISPSKVYITYCNSQNMEKKNTASKKQNYVSKKFVPEPPQLLQIPRFAISNAPYPVINFPSQVMPGPFNFGLPTNANNFVVRQSNQKSQPHNLYGPFVKSTGNQQPYHQVMNNSQNFGHIGQKAYDKKKGKPEESKKMEDYQSLIKNEYSVSEDSSNITSEQSSLNRSNMNGTIDHDKQRNDILSELLEDDKSESKGKGKKKKKYTKYVI